MTTQSTPIPGYTPGRYLIDTAHSEVVLQVRHMTVRIRGWFERFGGEIVIADDLLDSRVSATIEAGSFESGLEIRDKKIRTLPAFLDSETFPTISYRSTALRVDRRGYLVEGDFTLKGRTRSLPLDLTLHGFGHHPEYGTRVGFSATTEFNRREFGIDFLDRRGWTSLQLDDGYLLGDTVHVTLEIEAELENSRPEDGE
jgi:polyisoprenoid-binding protein YceI